MGTLSKSAEPQENVTRHLVLTSLASFIAGSIGRLVCHPLDTLKAKAQIEMSKLSVGDIFRRYLWNTAKQTMATEGIAGFYRGIGIAIAGSLPAGALYFGTYEWSKHLLQEKKIFGESQTLCYFFSGLIAETVSCIFWVPVDVIKERMQVQANLKTYHYRNTFDAIYKISKGEGLRGLYKAYGATIGSFGPYSAFYFMFYEEFKKLVVKEGQNIQFHQSLLIAGLSGSLASFITNPLDMVKLRMQVDRAERAVAQGSEEHRSRFGYRNLLTGMIHVYKTEGVLALFKGSLGRVMFFTPQTAIIMCLLETIRSQLEKIAPF